MSNEGRYGYREGPAQDRLLNAFLVGLRNDNIRHELKIMKQAASCKHRQAVKTKKCEKKVVQFKFTFFVS